MYVVAPTLAMLLWNHRDKETWEEYLQLPAYRRDMFTNLKAGDKWLMFPRPHLLGVLAGGVERAILRLTGEKKAMEGYETSLAAAASPVQNVAELTGPLKTALELYMNRDTFRDRDIVPMWERDLNLSLRKGAKHASAAGQGISGALSSAGLDLDPRQIDHVLRSMGGVGSLVINATRKDADLGDVALKATGYAADPPGVDARDVQWVFDWAKDKGKLTDDSVKILIAHRTAVYEAKTATARVAAMKKLREFAKHLRAAIESGKK
jgi:hypothetical protein